MSDLISRDAVSSWLKQYGQDVLHGKYKFSLMYIWKNLMDLPSAELEIIRCGECKYWRADHTCKEHSLVSPMLAYDFCSRAERRTDETD